MTISSSTRKAGPVSGNGVTDTIPFTFKVFSAADVQVVQRVTATDTETTLVLTTDYTVSLNADQDADPGGDVVIVDPATDWPTGTTITVTSDMAETQAADITNRGGFYASVINNALDKLTILIQQLLEKVDRSLKFPISDSSVSPTMPGKAELANNVLAFDSNGNPVAGPGATNMQALIDAAEAVLANSNAGAVSYSGADLTGTDVDGALDNAGTRIVALETKATNAATLSGVAANATSLGTFTGSIIPDSSTIKAALQALETRAEAAGTWTPTITNVTNIDATSIYGGGNGHYSRVGNIVTFSIGIAINTTSASVFEIALSLPIASNFTNVYDANGVGLHYSGTHTSLVYADTSNDRLVVYGTASNANEMVTMISGQYIIK